MLPSRPEDVILASNAVEVLKEIRNQSDPYTAYKVVVALAEGKGLVAVGPKRMYHVQILQEALTHHRDYFRGSVVTTFEPNTSRQAAGAVVQGAVFTVDTKAGISDREVVVAGASLSFGAIDQNICEEAGKVFIGRLIAQKIRELST
jgi:hypothetical protein